MEKQQNWSIVFPDKGGEMLEDPGRSLAIPFTIIISCNLAAEEREINSNLNVPAMSFHFSF